MTTPIITRILLKGFRRNDGKKGSKDALSDGAHAVMFSFLYN